MPGKPEIRASMLMTFLAGPQSFVAQIARARSELRVPPRRAEAAARGSSRSTTNNRFRVANRFRDKEKTMAFNQEEFINQLSSLTVVELVQLTKALEDKWGVKAAPVAVAAAAGGGGGGCGRGSGRGEDRVHRRPQGRRREQDRRHQGRPRGHWPRSQGRQGPRRRRARRTSRPASTRPRPRTSRRSSRKPAPRSRSSKSRAASRATRRQPASRRSPGSAVGRRRSSSSAVAPGRWAGCRGAARGP